MLLISLPTLAMEAPAGQIQHYSPTKHQALWRAPPSELTYDNVLHFLEELESGSLEQRCGEEELADINLFLVRLVEQGQV